MKNRIMSLLLATAFMFISLYSSGCESFYLPSSGNNYWQEQNARRQYYNNLLPSSSWPPFYELDSCQIR